MRNEVREFTPETERSTWTWARLHLLAMRARGLSFRIGDDGKILAGPAGLFHEGDRERLRQGRDVYKHLILAGDCPTCGHLLDLEGRCWKCCNRICVGCKTAWTGSAFLSLCSACGKLEPVEAEASEGTP